MPRNFLISLIAAASILSFSGGVSAADFHTWLQYDHQYDQLVGGSETNIYYEEFPDDLWCVQWGWAQNPWSDVPYEVCTNVLLYHHSAGAHVALFGPSGLNQSHTTESGWNSAGVGFSTGYPQIGTWNAVGEHYTIIDVYNCTIYFNPQLGGYVLNECYYYWSEAGYFLGVTTAQATVPPPCTLNALAMEELFSFPIKEPFERAASVKCVDGEPVITDKNDSFGNFHTLPGIAPIDDPCGSWSYAGQDSNSGTAHSHPWFDNADEFMEGLGCSGSVPGHIVVYPDQNLLNQQNSAGENISQGDIATFSGGVGPGYVRTSSGTKVKRYLSGVQTELLP